MASGIAPELDHEVAEAVDDGRVLAEVGRAVHVANGPDPLRHAIEIAEFPLQGCKDRQTREARSLVALLDGQVTADEALHEWGRAVERPVTGDICEAVVHLDEFEVEGVARRGSQRCRKRQAKLDQALFDSPHRSSLIERAGTLNRSQEGRKAV